MAEISSYWFNAEYLANAMRMHSGDDSICVESFELDSVDDKQYHGGVYRIRVAFTSVKRNVVSFLTFFMHAS